MTDHFYLNEFLRSKTADERCIKNEPSEAVEKQLEFTAAGMERIRAALGDLPIKILSGYRSPELNAAVGGSRNSQHIKGEACDFTCPAFGGALQVALTLKRQVKLLGIDQLILERGWVHVSFTIRPRYEILTLMPGGNYSKGIG